MSNLSQHSVQETEHDEDAAHDALHLMGDFFGYGLLLVFVLIGSFFVFRQKAMDYLRGLLK